MFNILLYNILRSLIYLVTFEVIISIILYELDKVIEIVFIFLNN